MSLCSNRLILFDFYGVISSEIAPKWFNNHIKDSTYAAILKNKYFKPADLGLFTFKETIHNMAIDLGFNEEEILTEMKSYAKLKIPLLDKIKELKKRNTIGLLSNAAIGIFDILFPSLDFNLYFDNKCFISCDYKIKNPDLKFYNLAVEGFDQNFDEIYFIDDNISNIKVLENTKIKGIPYKNNEELFKIINKF
jgi:FMN phosphatase YigB (HAD superfamily)